jgi:D-alanine-D-alanine ligase
LLERIRQLSLAAWTALGLRGYGRVDFRIDAGGLPWILEVNVNPCLSPDAGFAAALARDGVTIAQAVSWIVAEAQRPKTPYVATLQKPSRQRSSVVRTWRGRASR